MKPEPTPLGRSSPSPSSGICCPGERGILGTGRPKRRKYSSISASIPGNPVAPPERRIFSVVRMFTTDGPTRSTKGLKSGNPCTNTGLAAGWGCAWAWALAAGSSIPGCHPATPAAPPAKASAITAACKGLKRQVRMVCILSVFICNKIVFRKKVGLLVPMVNVFSPLPRRQATQGHTGVGAGGLGQRGQFHAAQLRQLLGDARQLRAAVAALWLAVLALRGGAIEPLRRHVGRIGFQHQAVQRQALRQVAQFQCALVGDGATKTQLEAQSDKRLRLLPAAIKRVGNAAHHRRGA